MAQKYRHFLYEKRITIYFNQMKTSVSLKLAETTMELEQILGLQEKNLVHTLSEADKKSNGFVTVRHDLDLLKKMNAVTRQIIAKDGDNVVGYALVMLKSFSSMIPVLQPMFDMFGKLTYKGKSLEDYSYYVMGQICIADTHRGMGIFEGLYAKHKEIYSPKFDICLTEISSSNLRSMRAHEKAGFTVLHNFDDKTDNWNIMIWDWNINRATIS
jgi:hypothetical protein